MTAAFAVSVLIDCGRDEITPPELEQALLRMGYPAEQIQRTERPNVYFALVTGKLGDKPEDAEFLGMALNAWFERRYSPDIKVRKVTEAQDGK